jgi:ribosomal protein S18 acetylase RimI-like enzyme
LVDRPLSVQGQALVVIIREFDPVRDSAALRDLFTELQDYERQLDPAKPAGSAVADPYLSRMWDRCREWNGRVFVAEVAGGVVGFACVWARVRPDEPEDDPSEYAYVSDLVVSAAHRRCGIGHRLLSAAECHARSQGARSLRISVLARNGAARCLYGSAGFEEYEVELVKPLG